MRRANNLAPSVISEDASTTSLHSLVVGIRPAREDGYRLEHERKPQGKHVLHAYGHGPNGYALSYGTADILVRMVEGVELEMMVPMGNI